MPSLRQTVCWLVRRCGFGRTLAAALPSMGTCTMTLTRPWQQQWASRQRTRVLATLRLGAVGPPWKEQQGPGRNVAACDAGYPSGGSCPLALVWMRKGLKSRVGTRQGSSWHDGGGCGTGGKVGTEVSARARWHCANRLRFSLATRCPSFPLPQPLDSRLCCWVCILAIPARCEHAWSRSRVPSTLVAGKRPASCREA